MDLLWSWCFRAFITSLPKRKWTEQFTWMHKSYYNKGLLKIIDHINCKELGHYEWFQLKSISFLFTDYTIHSFLTSATHSVGLQHWIRRAVANPDTSFVDRAQMAASTIVLRVWLKHISDQLPCYIHGMMLIRTSLHVVDDPSTDIGPKDITFEIMLLP